MARNRLAETIINFGAHRGKRFDEVPLKYLDWCLSQDWLWDETKAHIKAYLSDPSIKKLLEEELEE